MTAPTLDLPSYDAEQRITKSASPTAFRAIVAGNRIFTVNREAIVECGKAAAPKRETARCTAKAGPLSFNDTAPRNRVRMSVNIFIYLFIL